MFLSLSSPYPYSGANGFFLVFFCVLLFFEELQRYLCFSFLPIKVEKMIRKKGAQEKNARRITNCEKRPCPLDSSSIYRTLLLPIAPSLFLASIHTGSGANIPWRVFSEAPWVLPFFHSIVCSCGLDY